MKTIKKITVAITFLMGGLYVYNFSKKGMNKIQPCLKNSTHQGYITMVSDYIF
jgi:hypothetical protein